MKKEEFIENLIKCSPFKLEVTKDKFDFKNLYLYLNEGTGITYDIIKTKNGFEIKTDIFLNNFFNVIVVFGQGIKSEVVNFDSRKLIYSQPTRPQFVGLVSIEIN
jgi:hypothetical protein